MTDYLTPWPETRPVRPAWFTEKNAEMLGHYIGPETRCVIEVGSWYGDSARWICERAPAAQVYCIDPWEMYPEIAENPEWAKWQPGAYTGFLENIWEYRARVHILRWRSTTGLWIAYKHLGIQPDVIYLDGDHTAENVAAEIDMCRKNWSGAVIVGDDWQRWSVQAGIVAALSTADFVHCVANNGVCWVFDPKQKNFWENLGI